MTTEDKWVTDCGNDAHSKAENMGSSTSISQTLDFKHTDAPCAECLKVVKDSDLIVTLHGWCGCVEGDLIDEAMRDYLRYIAEHTRAMRANEDPGPSPTRDLIDVLLSAIADEHGWTEHGTSIRGCWITAEGTAALANLEKRLAL